jgi:hypothetical protein
MASAGDATLRTSAAPSPPDPCQTFLHQDSRLTLMRDGVAARALQGILPATRYVETLPRQTRVPCAALRRAPSADAEQLDQLLCTATLFEVLDETLPAGPSDRPYA